MSGKARKVACPRCGTQTVYSLENNWRPFCSERCRLIDLGKWATDEYRLPADQGSGQVSDDTQDTDKH